MAGVGERGRGLSVCVLSRRQAPESGVGLLRPTTDLDRFRRAVDCCWGSAGMPALGELGPGLALCPARVGDRRHGLGLGDAPLEGCLIFGLVCLC